MPSPSYSNTPDNVLKAYPQRFYASYDTEAPQPTIVRGWYDTWSLASLSHVPPASDMIAITANDWEDETHFRLPTGRGIQDGKIVDYTPPSPAISLTTQAKNVMQAVQQQASMVSAMGETFGPKMRDYVQALRAIISGSDTTSTALPTAPSDPTQ
ncbi:hypothetical protein [Saccharibacter floricola]|uniref:Uncharacterized protein n=1 Tax=Saccharibacter floricola DSM 15669 TaxID=1123227 RepID=A0ABQ0P120_9PROT|nr:hypothetical protein [Saccharibacter floricola]GBQ08738.1 hypothetical protein AA15669_1886 [Saccharibacter floricola DSM 15669]